VKMSKAFMLMVLFSLVVMGNSQSPTDSMRGSPIGIGDIAPDFILQDQNNNRVTLSDARGKRPVVLVFYRGYW
jgi:cytochrome oxidase Cu insertion factor (SCO1/SenC/PrrC family)